MLFHGKNRGSIPRRGNITMFASSFLFYFQFHLVELFFTLFTLTFFTVGTIYSTINAYKAVNFWIVWIRLFRNLAFFLLFFYFVFFGCYFSFVSGYGLGFASSFIFEIEWFILGLLVVLLYWLEFYGIMEKSYQFELVVILAVGVLGLFVMLFASNFLTFFIGVEMQNLMMYILLASRFKDLSLSLEAALKYFILAALASLLLLFGIARIYLVCGTLDFSVLSLLFPLLLSTSGVTVLLGGLACVLVMFLFKFTLVPFHSWALDVYEGGPLYTMYFFVLLSKAAYLATFIILFTQVFRGSLVFFRPIIFWSSFFSIALGVASGLTQVKIKRLLAYSSVVHMGLMFLVFVQWYHLHTMFVLFFYFFMYSLMNIAMFHVLFMWKFGFSRSFEYISDFLGLRERSILLASGLACIFFSFVGLPPFVGFWAKATLLSYYVAKELWAIVFLIILGSMISAYYYLGVVRVMWFESGKKIAFYTNYSPVSIFVFIALVLTLFGVGLDLWQDILEELVVSMLWLSAYGPVSNVWTVWWF